MPLPVESFLALVSTLRYKYSTIISPKKVDPEKTSVDGPFGPLDLLKAIFGIALKLFVALQ